MIKSRQRSEDRGHKAEGEKIRRLHGLGMKVEEEEEKLRG